LCIKKLEFNFVKKWDFELPRRGEIFDDLKLKTCFFSSFFASAPTLTAHTMS